MFNYVNVYVIKYKNELPQEQQKHSKEKGWARQICLEYSTIICDTEQTVNENCNFEFQQRSQINDLYINPNGVI